MIQHEFNECWEKRKERPYTEQKFVIHHWNYTLLTWETWQEGRTHTRINQGKRCEK